MPEPKLHWERRTTKIGQAVNDPQIYDLLHERAGLAKPVVVGVIRQEGGQWRGEIVGEVPHKNGLLFTELGAAKNAVRAKVVEKLKRVP